MTPDRAVHGAYHDRDVDKPEQMSSLAPTASVAASRLADTPPADPRPGGIRERDTVTSTRQPRPGGATPRCGPWPAYADPPHDIPLHGETSYLYVDGRTLSEINNELGAHIGAVSQWLNNAEYKGRLPRSLEGLLEKFLRNNTIEFI